MIELANLPAGAKVLDLGGGDNPHPAATCNVDVRPGPNVSFPHDLTVLPWPLMDAEWDVVHAAYVLEHVPYAAVPAFLTETFRILKPGGRAVFVLPDTHEQINWILRHMEGWDGKDCFEAASELLYGSQNMPGPGGQDANTHKAYFGRGTAMKLFKNAGFTNVHAEAYNERGTDMVVVATRPDSWSGTPFVSLSTHAAVAQTPQEHRSVKPEVVAGPTEGQGAAPTASHPPLQLKAASVGFAVAQTPRDVLVHPDTPREQLFDKHYFNGGGKVGGYAREGFWDFPVHEVTARHVLDRRPESVLELGCARGYILKRLQDAGVWTGGLEISRHCWMTRVCDSIYQHDLCQMPWPCWPAPPGKDGGLFDLCFSIATLEHVPEEHLPAVIREMFRAARRQLHGIDFGENDDGFDQTHCTLHDRAWWLDLFYRNSPYARPDGDDTEFRRHVEIVDKERLENADLLPEGAAAFWEGLRRDDGLIKLNVGSFTTMFYRHWENIDAVDLLQFAQHHGYHWRHWDVRNGLPHATGSVDLIFSHHFLEHLTYAEGLTFLRECRRVLKPGGAMRVVVPDAGLLARTYARRDDNWGNGSFNTPALADFDEINDGCAAVPTAAAKLWELLVPGHQAAYDAETLLHQLEAAGFHARTAPFRGHGKFDPVNMGSGPAQILRETTEMCFGGLSLFADAIPKLG